MHGHANINLDEKKVSYEYPKPIPMILQGSLLLSQLEKWKAEGRTSAQFEVATVDKMLFRNLSLAELEECILKFEQVLEDLKWLKLGLHAK